MTQNLVRAVTLIFLLAGGAQMPAVLAQDEVGSKGIKAEEFISKRPAKPAVRRSTPAKKPTYKTSQVIPTVVAPPGKEFAQVGLTLWRFRPATAADKTKELVEEDGDAPSTEWSLERIEEGTLLAPGQRIRLSVESLSRNGYLYVVNREEYADGSFGDARLIFPTKRTPEGANQVKAERESQRSCCRGVNLDRGAATLDRFQPISEHSDHLNQGTGRKLGKTMEYRPDEV
jgi:hypothetical protein